MTKVNNSTIGENSPNLLALLIEVMLHFCGRAIEKQRLQAPVHKKIANIFAKTQIREKFSIKTQTLRG
jgi:hypothetical protein